MKHVIALSGGKDSTAMALLMAEREPRDYTYLITPTGNELPPMKDHWSNLEKLLGKKLTSLGGFSLGRLIEIQKALPNNQMRWCTRMLKIEPCLAWMRQNQPAVLYVGLRADEEKRQGIYSEEFQCRFPLREFGWTEADVMAYLWDRGVRIPYRTDCAWCYAQRLSQWRRLWQEYPAIFWQGQAYEEKTGHTFRNPSRDNWPAGMKELAQEFSRGRIPRGADDQMDLFEEQEHGACRVCTL